MEIFSVEGVKITGIVGCVPENIVDNKNVLSELYGDKIDTLIKATGFRYRAISKKETTSLDLCLIAAEDLLGETKTDPSEIGGLIIVTFTPENIMPGDAHLAQSRLKLNNNIIAFDVNLACSGYAYGLYLAATISKATNKKVLLLDGDVQSKYTSGQDLATAPVLSDAGTATLVEPHVGSNKWLFSFYSNGENRESLFIPSGGSRNPYNPTDTILTKYEDGSQRSNVNIYMDGFEIYKFVATTVRNFIMEFMDSIKVNFNVVDSVAFHQANMFMIQQLAKKLKIDETKILKSGHKYGNPSSASVPLTIADTFLNSCLKKDITQFIAGFGGGLSIGTGLIDLNSDTYFNIIKKG